MLTANFIINVRVSDDESLTFEIRIIRLLIINDLANKVLYWIISGILILYRNYKGISYRLSVFKKFNYTTYKQQSLYYTLLTHINRI